MFNLRKILSLLAFIALAYPFIMYFSQTKFYLFPDKEYVSPKNAGSVRFKEHPFVANDGIKIMNWYAKGDSDKPAILFFHGNTGQIATFGPLMAPYIRNGYSVMMPEYRGFASTSGKFSQENLYNDAITAYNFLKNNFKHKEIIVMGYSMGSAPASFVAKNKNPFALILVAPFYSLKEVAGEQNIPLAKLLIKYELPSYKYIKSCNVPTLFVHGANDTLINSNHSKKLFALSPSKQKEYRLIDKINHHDLFFGEYAHTEILDWLNKL